MAGAFKFGEVQGGIGLWRSHRRLGFSCREVVGGLGFRESNRGVGVVEGKLAVGLGASVNFQNSQNIQ